MTIFGPAGAKVACYNDDDFQDSLLSLAGRNIYNKNTRASERAHYSVTHLFYLSPRYAEHSEAIGKVCVYIYVCRHNALLLVEHVYAALMSYYATPCVCVCVCARARAAVLPPFSLMRREGIDIWGSFNI